MAKSKQTKKALLSSVIALILCCSMLIGTTFAWFTDSVTSANNIIKSGNLDIELEYWDGDSWEDVEGKSDILTNTLWEPGVTEVAYLRVANAGSLALKYQLGINIISEIAGVNVAGEAFKLSNYIQFGVVEGVNGETGAYASREAAVAAVTEAKKISAGYTKAASMDDGQELYLALVVWMPTTVGNEANYKTGTTAPQIDLGINIFATQFTNESDSFDENYDGGAQWIGDATIGWYLEGLESGKYVIASAEDLAGLAAIVNGTATSETSTYATTGVTIIQDDFAGKTVELASDIDLADKNWTPIGSFDYDRDAQTYANVVAFKGTFDGQGHTINNLKINTPNTDGAALFACAEAATIKNVNIHNVDIIASGHAAPVLARGYNYSKTTTVTNCHVTGNLNIQIDWAYAGGIVAKATGLNISDCSVLPSGTGAITAANRNAVGGIVGWVEAVGASTISNCRVKNMKLTGWANIGSINGYIQAGCTITGCSAENIVLTKTRADGHPTIGLVAGGFSYNATQPVYVTNNSVKNITLNGTHIAAPASANILYGAEFSGNANSNFVLDNNTTEEISNNLVEVTKVTDGIVESNGIKQIYNANGLKSLSGQKISGEYQLIADIDLGGAEFKAMSAWYASATFNGNGYTISNAKVVSGNNDNGTEQASMFFVSTNGSLTVSNLTLKNITIATKNVEYGYAAAVVGYCEGALVLNNVDVVNANVTGSKSSGMLVGHLTPTGSLTATDCDVAGSVTISDFEASGHYAGKYVGTIDGDTALSDCSANVTIGGNLKNSNVGDIYGRKLSGELTIDGALQMAASNQDALNSAVSVTGNVAITLSNGEYKMPNSSTTGKVTISGTKETVLDVTQGAYLNNADGVTIEGVTIKTSTGMANGNGADYAALYTPNVTYKNCTFVGPMRVGRDGAKFINCTFTNLGNDYIWNYGNDVTFEGCTFNTDGKAILLYSDGGNEVAMVTVKNCVFNSTQGAKAGAIANQNCAAIEIHNYGNGVNLVTEGNTYDSNFSGEWRIKTYEIGKTKVFVNGVEYTQIALDGKLMTIDANKNVTVQ